MSRLVTPDGPPVTRRDVFQCLGALAAALPNMWLNIDHEPWRYCDTKEPVPKELVA